MARKLNSDGVPVEIPSIQRTSVSDLFKGIIDPKPGEGSKEGSSGDDVTRVGDKVDTAATYRDETPTRPAGLSPKPNPDIRIPESGGDTTRIPGGGRMPPISGTSSPSPEPPTQIRGPLGADPVVGWLVVVKGPGKGFSIRLGMGQNSVGRGEDARARVNFGDNQISRSNHTSISYDPQGNKFYISPGTGRNLTHLDGAPVLQTTALVDRCRISMGQTTLRFVALCGEGFSWNDREKNPRAG